MCDNEAERADWLRCIREAMARCGSPQFTNKTILSRRKFPALVKEFEGLDAESVKPQELKAIIKKIRDVFNDAALG